MTSESDSKAGNGERQANRMDRRQFLKVSGTMATLLPWLALPRFTEGKPVQRPAGPLPATAARHALWYDTPAAEANLLREGLPVGNGRIGALVGGDPASTCLYLTDASMWLGKRDVALGQDGQFDYSTQSFGSLVMLARLYLSIDGHDAAHISHYRRELDLDQGYLRISYRKDGIGYNWNIFASHPDDVIAIQVSQTAGGTFSGSLTCHGMHGDVTRAVSVNGDGMAACQFDGTLANGLRYAAHALASASSGRLDTNGEAVHFANCSTLSIIVCGGTNYTPDVAAEYMDATLNPLVLATRKASTAARQDPVTLLHTHVADYRSLFDAMHVDLGASTTTQRAMDTWARLKARAETGSSADPEFEATYLQYGRYLTIAGSRDSLPTGLQGLWLDSNESPWMADYHNDINIQMNYWLPDRAALPSCFDPFTRYCLSQVGAWTEATRKHFNDPRNNYRNSSGKLAGWTVGISTNIYGGGGWRWHPAGNAWLCNNLWQHYQYRPDPTYLAQIYPLLKGACEFWEARLLTVSVKDPASGHMREVLIDDADWSPEHGPTDAKGNTYSQEWVWDLFENYRQASALLGKDADYAATVAQLQARLYLPQVSPRTGWLEEWMSPDDLGEPQHRHLSPLVGFFPGDRIRTDNSPPALIEGVTKLLEARGTGGYGWASAWRAMCWARLGQAEKAYQLVLNNLKPSVQRSNGTALNLFDMYQLDADHDAFQIDANYGTPTAMLEMLVSSRPGVIRLLPALPTAWAASGSVTGIGARGGFQVDLAWKQGKVTSVTVRSVGGKTTRLMHGSWVKDITLPRGGAVTLSPNESA
ncbi:glycosyl hydrolase family 95 catalytic domain-containing protein [Luteibacter aegosomatissinici]|uniref:glycosyl hydrolase family 95 catalytic domain-containing protein n=1 Tax=Luteibacter aegosomatissinici TaxID=2911539 RepID=UPI001FFAF66B|nr:glycoside hydrolase N-terminal domain-containing protein [Luteibacter aegosomatissinici]UPG93000.1 glycoside hydrolase family 95 protein [Luteibacter aegosomatissinici]